MRVGLLLFWLLWSCIAVGLDHSPYARVLEAHVRWNPSETATRVDYKALQADPSALNRYLEQLSSVSRADFDGWPQNRQLAFLINAYNAFTLKLIIDHYPVNSIRDIGGFWQGPWDMRFFTLLGEERTLDELEHEMIREPGVYNEPRIHFAVNCAAIGCPALRPEPYTGERLDRQLADGTHRFLRDRSRNRYRDGRLEVSRIFKWYREDFQRGWQGIDRLDEFFLGYRDALDLDADAVKRLRDSDMDYRFLDYDWRLNDRQ